MTDLASVIKSIESGGHQYAVRFEPHAYETWNWAPAMDRIQKNHQCSRDTAKMLACTSFGYYQILGVNIFDPVISSTYLIDPPHVFAYVGDVGMQDRMFAAFLDHKNIVFQLQELLDNPDKMTRFVTHWNGPGNVAAYSELIRQHAATA